MGEDDGPQASTKWAQAKSGTNVSTDLGLTEMGPGESCALKPESAASEGTESERGQSTKEDSTEIGIGEPTVVAPTGVGSAIFDEVEPDLGDA